MTAIIGCNIKIKPHDKAWIRVPNRNTNPKQKIPNERPKIETLIKYNKLEKTKKSWKKGYQYQRKGMKVF